MTGNNINISDFDYPLPDERIAKFPVGERDASKLLVWDGRTREDGSAAGVISETLFGNIGSVLPQGSLLVFNNTRVVRARLVMHKVATPTAATAMGTAGTAATLATDTAEAATPSPGARIEILCLEPHSPADYERAFAAKGTCEWSCMIGNSKKWKSEFVECGGLRAWRKSTTPTPGEQIVRLEWDTDETFGEVLERLGRMPIPPYLDRDSAEIDNTRYQTVYARFEGSVAAPTAGLHFTPELIARLASTGTEFEGVTLHVGAGTFLPVKTENALEHPMHTEHFEVTLTAVEHLIAKQGHIIAVGTTSVRTLESLSALAYRIHLTGSPDTDRPIGQFGRNADGEITDRTAGPQPACPIGQFELNDIPAEFTGEQALQILADYLRTRSLQKIAASTRIMITPGFRFRIVDGIITNFHQPKSTLLLLVSAFVGGGKEGNGNSKTTAINEWRRIYDYALSHDFRFLSYGDSSLLIK